jgi:hypothetical protein
MSGRSCVANIVACRHTAALFRSFLDPEHHPALHHEVDRIEEQEIGEPA